MHACKSAGSHAINSDVVLSARSDSRSSRCGQVFGLNRFRETELINGRWAMLATLGVVVAEATTGVAWQDAGKVELDGASYLGFSLPFTVTCAHPSAIPPVRPTSCLLYAHLCHVAHLCHLISCTSIFSQAQFLNLRAVAQYLRVIWFTAAPPAFYRSCHISLRAACGIFRFALVEF